MRSKFVFCNDEGPLTLTARLPAHSRHAACVNHRDDCVVVASACDSRRVVGWLRLGMVNLWDDVNAWDGRNHGRRSKLRAVSEWRNAIAHQDFSKVGGTTALVLGTVQSWRTACDGLAASFDTLVGDYAYQVVGERPW